MYRLKRSMAAMLKKMRLHMPNSLSEHLQIFRILWVLQLGTSLYYLGRSWTLLDAALCEHAT